MIDFAKNRKCYYAFCSFCFFLLLIGGESCFAQLKRYVFAETSVEVPVMRADGSMFAYPWAGGLNSPHFSAIDINNDGLEDVVAFEKHGNIFKVFLRLTSDTAALSARFAYNDSLSALFPACSGWAMLKDFDGDYQPDLFTYNGGGIRVYKNNDNHFVLYSDMLLSDHGTGMPVNIFCTPDDYIGLFDMDNDGDLDILTFSALGRFIQFHRNMSMERYGDLVHLEFVLVTNCFGHIAEGEDSNEILLNEYCDDIVTTSTKKRMRHAGSTFWVEDLNHDGLLDLVLGDVDYPNVIALLNGGTSDEAHFVSQTSLFPNVEDPINLASFPSLNRIDISNNGVPDLLVSPFDPSLNKAENAHSVWLYLNDGTDYSLYSTAFLQEEMLEVGSGAYPVLADLNNDGLLDLIVGNYGYYSSDTENIASIAYLKNVGTATRPQFQWQTADLGGLQQLGLQHITPTFADLNGDGLLDMVFGTLEGTLFYAENQSENPDMPRFAEPQSMNIDPIPYAAPHLTDLNNDGLIDLVVGNRKGKVLAFLNTGTSQHAMFTPTDLLDHIDVRNQEISFFGNAMPTTYRNGDELHLYVGNATGDLFHYQAVQDSFALVEKQVLNKLYGVYLAAALADLTSNGMPEMIVGNFAGGLNFFTAQTVEPVSGIASLAPQRRATLSVSPNPATTSVAIARTDGLPLTADNTTIYIYNSIGTACQLLTRFADGQLLLNTSHLSAGVYIIRVHSCHEVFFERFVIR